MIMTLQQAIDTASPWFPPGSDWKVEMSIIFSMHDEDGFVLVGEASGTSGGWFSPDLPLGGTSTIDLGGGVSTTTPGGGGRVATPGFSTRGLSRNDVSTSLTSVTPDARGGVTFPDFDFSVARNPGSPLLFFPPPAGFGLPSVRIEIDLLVAGTATTIIGLEPVEEDGALLRAAGPSLRNPAVWASYAASIDVNPVPIVP